MSRNDLFGPHLQVSLTSDFGESADHSPTSHSRPWSSGYARDGTSVTSAGRSRALEMSHLPSVLVQTTAYRLNSLHPSGPQNSSDPSWRTTSGRRVRIECSRAEILCFFSSGSASRNIAEIASLGRVALPDSSMYSASGAQKAMTASWSPLFMAAT